MITFIKKLFGLNTPAVAEAKTEVPYKVETPAPKAVVVENAEVVPVGHADILVTIAKPNAPAKPKATVKKQQFEKKTVVAKPPTAAKTPPKPRAPRKPAAK